MRRYLIVAAAAGGLLLLGGAPAYADQDPAGPLGGLLDPAGGVNLENPLGDSPVIKVKPGTNTPALPTLPGAPAAPTEGGLPSARTGLGGAKPARPAEPAADVVKSLRDDDFAVADVPVGDLLNGGGLTGLMPDGSAPGGPAPVASKESGLLGGGVPLLGGLGGLLPEPARTLPADVPDASGMPGGGTAVDPADTGTDKPAGPDPAASSPAAEPQPNGPGDDDKRLHEEPIDDEAGGGRTFSDGRPVAGQDPDYK
jgi:hypothetical protein